LGTITLQGRQTQTQQTQQTQDEEAANNNKQEEEGQQATNPQPNHNPPAERFATPAQRLNNPQPSPQHTSRL
jgi:hypothetical protein